jgi:hypothetical protein
MDGSRSEPAGFPPLGGCQAFLKYRDRSPDPLKTRPGHGTMKDPPGLETRLSALPQYGTLPAAILPLTRLSSCRFKRQEIRSPRILSRRITRVVDPRSAQDDPV